MIVWLNGAFGVGKTTTAIELCNLLPASRIHDPEVLGWVLQRTIGRLQRGDYQHLRSWRRGTVALARWATRRDTTVVVPMSVLRPDYLDGLMSGLRAHGHDVHHVLLDAPLPVLQARITDDATQRPTTIEWRREHVDNYRDVRGELASRGITVDTSDASPPDVAASVAYALGFVGTPDLPQS